MRVEKAPAANSKNAEDTTAMPNDRLNTTIREVINVQWTMHSIIMRTRQRLTVLSV